MPLKSDILIFRYVYSFVFCAISAEVNIISCLSDTLNFYIYRIQPLGK